MGSAGCRKKLSMGVCTCMCKHVCSAKILPARHPNLHPGLRRGSEWWRWHGCLVSRKLWHAVSISAVLLKLAQYMLSGTGVGEGEDECAGEDMPLSAFMVVARTCVAEVDAGWRGVHLGARSATGAGDKSHMLLACRHGVRTSVH